MFFRQVKIILEMIKFEHTIFALPFAIMSAFLAAEGLPVSLIYFGLCWLWLEHEVAQWHLIV